MRTPSLSVISNVLSKRVISRTVVLALATLAFFFASDISLPQSAAAYPFWAQQTAPETP
jgi:apocytochrome f